MPDPVADFAAYLPYVLLTEVLTSGDASRLEQRLVQKDRLVTSIETYLGTFGDPFDQRDPLLLTLETYYPPTSSADDVLAVVDEELDRLATDGPEAGELDRVRARLSARLFREVDDVLGRTLDDGRLRAAARRSGAAERASRAARGGHGGAAVVGGCERAGPAEKPAGAASGRRDGRRRQGVSVDPRRRRPRVR